MKKPDCHFRKSRNDARNGLEPMTSWAAMGILTGKSENMALTFRDDSIYIITMPPGFRSGVWGARIWQAVQKDSEPAAASTPRGSNACSLKKRNRQSWKVFIRAKLKKAGPSGGFLYCGTGEAQSLCSQ